MKTKCSLLICPATLPEVKCIEELGAKRQESLAHLAQFDLWDQDPHFEEILELVEKIRQREGHRAASTFFTLHYTEAECEAAQFLRVRSCCAGFDSVEVPEQYELSHFFEKVIVYKDKGYDRYEHVKQKLDTMTEKPPKWRAARQFCSDYGSNMVNLYCSDLAMRTIEKAGLTGASFRPVRNAKTGEPLPDLWQLWPQECEDFLAPGEFTMTRPCPVCGRTRYVPNDRGRMRVRAELVPQDLDFMQVPSCYGADRGYPFYVISHKAYRLLRDASLDRSLIFEPLEQV